jgi:DNA polymerase III subunit epsilon
MLELAVDCETTGIGAEDRIVSLAVVSVRGFVEGANHKLEFNPGRPSHPRALEKHGLSDAYLATKPLFAEMAPALHELLSRADLIVAHNAAFDLKMLNREFALCGLAPIETESCCTMQFARDWWPGEPSSLDACVARIGLARSSAVHGALEDAMLAAALYRHFHGIEIADTTPVSPQAAPALPAKPRAEPKPLMVLFYVLIAMAVVWLLAWAAMPAKAPKLSLGQNCQYPCGPIEFDVFARAGIAAAKPEEARARALLDPLDQHRAVVNLHDA